MRLALALILALLALPAAAAECRQETYRDNAYTICEVDLTREQLELFLTGENGTAFGHFANVDAALSKKGKRLGFATNAGMYHEDRSPVGYYLENGTQFQQVMTRQGPGNFGLLPNGVLCLREARADVFETQAFLKEQPDCRSATQSGPMLVIDGALHPRFLRDSTSRYIRNGVGTTADGKRAIFAISDTTVTFHAFGTLFRDHLKLPNALYLDGNISRLRAPELGRSGTGFTALGPIIGVVEAAQ
ncbi:phosphodiester glycosidase family protein [Marimonas sp. MJW-29]|uniref:Phosphodiester glycosidase family protein n=1 Tax=Sulfitobacter sediminis TaxID=3234186 RepID=A0ABV3RLL7_9RHOB